MRFTHGAARLRDRLSRRMRLAPERRSRPAELIVDAGAGAFTMPANLARGLAAMPRWDLVVDLVRGQLVTPQGSVAIHGVEIVMKLFAVLIEGAGRPIPVRELYERVWGMRWVSPRCHTAAVHVTVHRARRLLAQVGHQDRIAMLSGTGYSFHLGRSVIALRHPPARRGPIAPSGDASPILACIRERGYVDNRDLRARCGRSRATIYRELRRLVAAGALVMVGRGRAARYEPASSSGWSDGARSVVTP